MKLGFIGLGKMGMNMATRLLQHKHEVVVFARHESSIEAAVVRGAEPSYSLQGLVEKLSAPRIIWLMVPAGLVTEEVINKLIPLLQAGDVIIDGGNSMYKDSMRRATLLSEHKIDFLDVGTSGGVWGLSEGYCLMVGGNGKVFAKVEPLFTVLAPKDGYAHVGPIGAGHYAKMIHNGIEYAMLQAYGEGFELIRAKKDFAIDMAKLSKLWNHGGVIRSWLLEMAESAFSEDPQLESVLGYVEDSGEGRWAVAAALEEAIPAPVITLALMERFQSRLAESFSAKLVAALRKKFGGHTIKAK